MNKNNVILVNEQDQEIGQMEKMEAHQKGLLHRAISVFIFNSKNEWLLQQRAADKYHSGLLWSNTCCSHPYPKETNQDAAERRLREEMGMKVSIKWIQSFKYKAILDNNLTEHELDHIFIGYSDDVPTINTSEVCNYKYISTSDLEKDIQNQKEKYTEWFKLLFLQIKNTI